jgi:type II secretory pathway predicted ATPase ExeA
MYLEHFNLEDDPFRLSPDAKFYYGSLSHSTAKEYMDYVLWSRDSFVVITGDIGTGKTTLIQKMLEDAGPKITVAKIHQTQLNEIEFIQALLDQLGVNPFETESKVKLLSMLNDYLQEKYEEGETVVVIIDEAQNLKPRVLEEIRLLSGFDSNREKLLNIFLVGQPELRDTLFSPQMEQLFQRIRLRFHLEGLGFDEVRSYIRHRLAVSSEKRFYPLPATRKLVEFQPPEAPLDLPTSLFPDKLMGKILEYTGGIPRLINTLCDTALLTAFARDQKKVGFEDIDAAIEELQWLPYHERTSYRQIRNKTAKYKLHVLKGGVSFSEVDLHKDEILVGRSHLCDIKIDQTAVSGKHFKLVSGANGYTVLDMNSTNGTLVNGNQIERWELKDGDSIEIGSYSLRYKENESVRNEDQILNFNTGHVPKQSLLDKLT